MYQETKLTPQQTRIFDFVKQKKEVSAKSIIEFLGTTEAAVFRHLKALVEIGALSKTGTPPKVFYFISPKNDLPTTSDLPLETNDVIEKNFFLITPQGAIIEGISAFARWCADRGLDLAKTAAEYITVRKKNESFRQNGLINGQEKFANTFTPNFLDEIYYLDFYSYERFGKTKLGSLLLHAKQAQNKKLIAQIAEMVRPRITKLIIDKKIDAVGFIPPTITRKVQFQKELERILRLPVPRINLVKTKNAVAVAQKSLSKLEDRVANARATIFVDDRARYRNILLIDDAVGSGATFNETARKIKESGVASGQVIGLAITGSFKGFDVISEA